VENSDLDSHPTNRFIRAFTDAQYLISRRSRLGHIWKLGEIRRDKSKKFVVDIDRLLRPITEAALARGRDMAKLSADSKLPGEIENDMTFLDHMVTQTQGTVDNDSNNPKAIFDLSSCTDPEIIRDSLMNMLIAGRDTVRPSPRPI
jgi:hypothetical protein